MATHVFIGGGPVDCWNIAAILDSGRCDAQTNNLRVKEIVNSDPCLTSILEFELALCDAFLKVWILYYCMKSQCNFEPFILKSQCYFEPFIYAHHIMSEHKPDLPGPKPGHVVRGFSRRIGDGVWALNLTAGNGRNLSTIAGSSVISIW